MECNSISNFQSASTVKTRLLYLISKMLDPKDVRATTKQRWLLYGREQYLKRVSIPEWVPTTLQVADIFTKPLDLTTSENSGLLYFTFVVQNICRVNYFHSSATK